MSIKKLLVLAAAGVATMGVTSAMAGGVDSTYSAPMAATAPTSYFYVQGQVGYATTNWQKQLDSGSTNWTKPNGGFTWGVDAGYMWTQNLGLEVGYFMFPEASNSGTVLGVANGSIDSWALYGAVKFAVPIYPNLDIYAKAGVSYNRAKWGGTGTLTGTSGAATTVPVTYHNWGFVGGAGVDYTFDNNIFVNVQYMRFAGNNNDSIQQTTNPNVYTAGVGYKFAM